jgi:pimeloyl-ACP methyl ester carboxylesterase
MAELTRPDGARIHYEVQGESGPTIVLASYWSWSPGIYGEILGDLAADHRALTYHLRGSGDSSRQGPFDMETDVGDLEAVAEAAGGAAVLVTTADGSNRAARLASRRPDLGASVVCFGAAPFARDTFADEEGMVSSNTVVDAFVETLETNFRGTMRNFMAATNPQMSEAQLRQRVTEQEQFCGRDPSVARLRAWLGDDPRQESKALGGRLWVFLAASVAGPWLPPGDVVERLTRETLPEANLISVEPGPISAPAETAAAIRRVAASAQTGPGSGQK